MRSHPPRAIPPAPPRVAIYARVSSDQQAERHTIDSQLGELKARASRDGHPVRDDMLFVDNGHSGASLVRPALERLRDLVALAGVDILYVHAPDRLARSYAHQVLLLEEFARAGTEVVFLNRPIGDTPEDNLLLQLQGMFAEYERAKMLERSRRGKRHRAQAGAVSVLVPRPVRLPLRHARGRRTARRATRSTRTRPRWSAGSSRWVGARAPDARRGVPAAARRRHPQPVRQGALEPGHDPHDAAEPGLRRAGRLRPPAVRPLAGAAASAPRARRPAEAPLPPGSGTARSAHHACPCRRSWTRRCSRARRSSSRRTGAAAGSAWPACATCCGACSSAGSAATASRATTTGGGGATTGAAAPIAAGSTASSAATPGWSRSSRSTRPSGTRSAGCWRTRRASWRSTSDGWTRCRPARAGSSSMPSSARSPSPPRDRPR